MLQRSRSRHLGMRCAARSAALRILHDGATTWRGLYYKVPLPSLSSRPPTIVTPSDLRPSVSCSTCPLLSLNKTFAFTSPKVVVPKAECAKPPPTTSLGPSGMTEALIRNMESRRLIAAGDGRTPPQGECTSHPEEDDIVIFKDSLITGLRFPTDPMLVDIIRLYIYMHQLMPNSFL